jgi:hypothetical protein
VAATKAGRTSKLYKKPARKLQTNRTIPINL